MKKALGLSLLPSTVFGSLARWAVAAMTLTSTAPVQARDTQLAHSISEAMSTEEAKAALDSGIRLYFGNQPTPPIAARMHEVAFSRKSNGIAKTDEIACKRAFLSTLRDVQAAARSAGGNAVVNIKSNYRSVESTSDTEYVCGSGAWVSGVALKGTIVKIGD